MLPESWVENELGAYSYECCEEDSKGEHGNELGQLHDAGDALEFLNQ